MTRAIVLRQAARAEFDEAGDWYEAQRPGLGKIFGAAVEAVFRRIADRPRMHGIVLGDVRKAVVKGFPYCVFYRERGKTVVVLAVFHSSRDPKIWQKRVE